MAVVLRIRHETEEHLRDRMLTAADDFSTGMRQALKGLEPILDLAESNPDEPVEAESRRLIAEADARLGRIDLLFGPRSPAGDAAFDAFEGLENALDALRPLLPVGLPRQGEEAAEVARERAWENLGRFQVAAIAAVRKPRRSHRSRRLRRRIERWRARREGKRLEEADRVDEVAEDGSRE